MVIMSHFCCIFFLNYPLIIIVFNTDDTSLKYEDDPIMIETFLLFYKPF